MMIPIYIEDKKYIVKKSRNLLEICLSLGFNIPYFCWHPALGSIGACRQCAVKCCDNNLNKNSEKLVMSCMTPVKENMCISIFDKDVQSFRKGVLELLMINHPHDCPVCEEGGNCHLQDMTVMTGHIYRRYRFAKRTHYNQDLGPLISHEMNRCITCYRCVRYYKDYAGGDDLGVFGVHDNIYFGRVQDGMLQSEFSGNLIEICPTGVFVDKTRSRSYARKWDIIFAPSICQQCSVGCNIIVGERYGKLCRVENRYNGNINGYFLCDRGRFGCDYVNLDNRPKKPLIRYNSSYVEIDNRIDAIERATKYLKCSNRIIGIGSTRASIESNFALRKLVGSNNFYMGVDRLEQKRLAEILDILYNGGIYVPSVREIEDYDAVLILGEDITQTGSRIALSIRQAIKRKSYDTALCEGILNWQSEAVSNFSKDDKYPLFITSVDKTKLDELAMFTYYDSIQNQARFALAIAHDLDNTAPIVEDFDCKLYEKLKIIVGKLVNARKPLIVSGSSSGSIELIGAAFNIANALKNRGSAVGIILVVNDVNSIGLSMIATKSLDDAFDELCNDDKKVSTSLIVLENDLYRYVDSDKIKKALNNVNYFMVLDHQQNLINKKADLVLSVASFVESDGTVINYEGRAQRFFRLYNPNYYDSNVVLLESWRWLYLIYDCYMDYIRKEELHIDYVIDEIIDCFPKLIGIKDTTPDANFRVHGQKIAQAPHRYSGRTAMHAHENIHEPCVPPNEETMFTFSMEGNYYNRSENNQVAFAWFPGWNSNQAWNKFQNQIGEHLYPEDPGMRLFDTCHDYNNKKQWFKKIPTALIIDENSVNWLIVPCWHVFGSEYTSQRSESIKDCMLEPYAMINVLDAKRLNIQENMFIRFKCSDKTLCLSVRFSVYLPMHHIGLPVGFPDIPLFFSGMYANNVEGVLYFD